MKYKNTIILIEKSETKLNETKSNRNESKRNKTNNIADYITLQYTIQYNTIQ